MRPITNYKWPSYQDLIDTFEVETLIVVDDAEYQGDSRVLLRDGRRYGLLFFGWGSCPGCDVLQGVSGDKEEVTRLRDDLWREVWWEDSAQAMLDYVNGKNWSLDYTWHAPEQREFLAKVHSLLESQVSV